MNNSNNNFQLIVVAVFGFFIVLGLVLFATYKSRQSGAALVNLKVWGTVSSADFNAFTSKLSQDGVTGFLMTYTAKSKDTFESDLVNALANGVGPDVVLVTQDFIYKDGIKLFTIPFTSYQERLFRDTFTDGSSVYLKSDGIYAIPFVVDPLVMYFNKDIFTDAGVAQTPKKWSEFPDLASRITKSDVNSNITRSAVAFGEFKNVDNAKEIISSLIFQTGNPIVSNSVDGAQSTLGNSDSSPAVKFYTDFSNPLKVVYSWNRALPSSKNSFLSGDLAMYFGFASEYNDIKAKNPNLNFDVANLPQLDTSKTKSTFGNIYSFGVLKTSPNIAQALSMIYLFTSNSIENTFASVTGLTPTRNDLLSALPSDAIQSVFYSSALMSKGWLDPDSAQTSKIFQNMIENISSGRSDVGSSVKDASGLIDNLLSR